MTTNGGDKVLRYNRDLSKHLGGYQEVLSNIQALLDEKKNNLDSGIFYNKNEKTVPLAIKQLLMLKKEFEKKEEEVKHYKKELWVDGDVMMAKQEKYISRLHQFFKKYKGALKNLKALYKDEFESRRTAEGKSIGDYAGIYKQLYLNIKTTIAVVYDELDELDKERTKLIVAVLPENGYDRNTSWIKKIEYVVNENGHVMTLSQIAESLIAHEPELLKQGQGKRDLIMLLSSVCIQNINKRLNRTEENDASPYFYGLTSYFDVAGKVIEKYMPNDS